MFFVPWRHTAIVDSDAVVVPDGCRDILMVEDAWSRKSISLTNWDDHARTVRLMKGQQMSGFRLCPGLSLDAEDLTGLETDEKEIGRFIEYLAAEKRESIELVQELSDYNVSFQTVARQAGVSTRTLQRKLKKLNLPRPEYWRLLCRARVAASSLSSRAPLVEIAIANGYSDQSHMTRDLARWFGATPVQLRQNSALHEELSQPGVGNWTGEHISIR